MKVIVKSNDAIKEHSVLVIPVFQGQQKEAFQYLLKYGYRQTQTLEDLVAQHHFTGKEGETVYLTPLKTPASAVLFCGLGKEDKINLEKVRFTFGSIVRQLGRLKYKDAACMVDIVLTAKGLAPEDVLSSIAEAGLLAHYSFKKYKSDQKDHDGHLGTLALICHVLVSQTQARKCVERGRIVAETINAIRDLGLEPANALTPSIFAEQVKQKAKDAGLSCDVFNKSRIEQLGMGGLLAVAKGSAEEPRFVVTTYTPKTAAKHVCLVGKGITFDSGGLSLKPAGGMAAMKYDMLGAATVVNIVLAAAKLALPVKITVVTPMTENMPSGTATHPGDVVKTMSGTTIEILNTDAEGRIILADALAYAKSLKPDYCIDFATLTGAARIVLGSKATALMGTNDELLTALRSIGERLSDRFWPLPLWEEYDDDIKSDIADWKNIGKDGEAGTIIGGKFLSKFIDGVAWAHCDIAATGWCDRDAGHCQKGPSGVTVRTIIAWLESVAAAGEPAKEA